MILAIDAMGGDWGPSQVCPGALAALESAPDLELVLIGDEAKIKEACARSGYESRYRILHTDEVVSGSDHPSKAIRSKRRSSLRLALEMVRSGEAAGCVSAGNTGAIVAGGVLVVGRVKGVDRPALSIMLPTQPEPTLMLDLGATVRCKPLNLVQFAYMGALAYQAQRAVDRPVVKLLSNGSEEIKGDEVIGAARDLLRDDAFINYGGYIEANDVPMGGSQIVVCDGFTGNVMLKTFEGMAAFGKQLIKDEVKQSLLAKLGMAFFIPSGKRILNKLDWQKYGGTPLLGLKGTVVKAHGRSQAPAIEGAVQVAYRSAQAKSASLLAYQMEELAERVGEAQSEEMTE